jgi:hypothetical protein
MSRIQPAEGRADNATATSDVTCTEIVVLPFDKARRRLAAARRDCEALKQGIQTLQQCLRTIESFAAKIDDGPERETLQGQVESLNRILLLRLHQVSDVEHSLREALRPVRDRRV